MEPRYLMWLSSAIIFFLASSVSAKKQKSIKDGKCRGKWATHACLGGNGKRSDPMRSGLEELNRERSLIRLLLREAVSSRNLVNPDSTYGDISERGLNEELNPDYLAPYEVDNVPNLLDKLILQQRLKDESKNLA